MKDILEIVTCVIVILDFAYRVYWFLKVSGYKYSVSSIQLIHALKKIHSVSEWLPNEPVIT